MGEQKAAFAVGCDKSVADGRRHTIRDVKEWCAGGRCAALSHPTTVTP
jgi:hypothetical protein